MKLTARERAIMRRVWSRAGKLGAKARAESLTPARRSEIARLGAETRWKKYRAAKADQPD